MVALLASQRQRLRELFEVADQDNSGRISQDEFRQLASQMGCQLSDALLVAVFLKAKPGGGSRGGKGAAAAVLTDIPPELCYISVAGGVEGWTRAFFKRKYCTNVQLRVICAETKAGVCTSTMLS